MDATTDRCRQANDLPAAGRSAEETNEARDLVLQHGWNSTCYQVLNQGIEHWWSRDRRGLVGFVRACGMAIVAGAPVCAEDRLTEVVSEWEAYAESQGLGVCYFGAESRLRSHLRRSPKHRQVVLGSQPEWTPRQFLERCRSTASLRAQLSRARNKGLRVVEWTREQAENSSVLRQVLHRWLETRGLPTMHFLVEPETLSDLRDRRIFVAERSGEVVGFVTLCPVPARSGWLTEQFVRAPNAPNGTVENMLVAAAEWSVGCRSEYLTMGIVPLLGKSDDSSAREPLWLVPLRRWAKAHTIRFYNFRGLYEFKAKFLPEKWEPVVVIVKAPAFGFSHLRAIAQAFTCTSPELALLQGLAKAVRAEGATLAAHLGLAKSQR